MTETNLMENKKLREQMATRVDVLDKVKELFLLPQLDMMTVDQIADYYEVGKEAIQKCYQRNRQEIEPDGVGKFSFNTLTQRVGQDVQIVKTRYYADFKLSDEVTLRVPNAGTNLFSKRAILRIGMLLRDSKIAQEVRTQLLNVFEKVPDEQKVEDIETERNIIADLSYAFADGDIVKFCELTMKLNAFHKRHIEELTSEKNSLIEENDRLNLVNQGLVHDTKIWDKRAVLNRLMRCLAYNGGFSGDYRYAYNTLYTELRYKKGICLSNRIGGKTLADRIRDDEWEDVLEVAIALCEENGVNVKKAINDANAKAVSK